MKKFILAVLLTAIFSSPACYAGTPAVEQGRKIFVKYCVKCHGEDGSGSEYGRYLKTNPVRDLRTNRLFLSESELFIVITTVRHGARCRTGSMY